MNPPRPNPTAPAGTMSTPLAAAICSVFLAIGLALLYFGVFKPWSEAVPTGRPLTLPHDTDWRAILGMATLGGMFALLGGLGVAASIFSYRDAYGNQLGYGKRPERDGDGRLVLKPEYGPVGEVFGAAIFAGMWNAFLASMTAIIMTSDGDKGMVFLILTPFWMVGIGLIGWTVRNTFGLFSPRIILLQNGIARAGGKLRLEWCAPHGAHRIRTLNFRLEALHQPADPDSNEKLSRTLEFPVPSLAAIPQGAIELDLPDEISPTYVAYRWRIRVRADVARGINLSFKHPVEILPAVK